MHFFELAAERAVERRAYRETELHYRDALAMLLTQPESLERNGQELRLQLALGSVLMATKGWAALETEGFVVRVGICPDCKTRKQVITCRPADAKDIAA